MPTQSTKIHEMLFHPYINLVFSQKQMVRWELIGSQFNQENVQRTIQKGRERSEGVKGKQSVPRTLMSSRLLWENGLNPLGSPLKTKGDLICQARGNEADYAKWCFPDIYPCHFCIGLLMVSHSNWEGHLRKPSRRKLSYVYSIKCAGKCGPDNVQNWIFGSQISCPFVFLLFLSASALSASRLFSAFRKRQ